jgi:CheY-like chemotaxis protein
MMEDRSQGETLELERNPEKPTILVVDDHPTQRQLFKLVAETLGVEAKIVSSCEEALDALTEKKYDVVLMDWQMPDTDGLACTALVRNQERDEKSRTPIVAVTAHVLPGDREKCLAAGMDDYLGKPFTIAELKETIYRWSLVSRNAKRSTSKDN